MRSDETGKADHPDEAVEAPVSDQSSAEMSVVIVTPDHYDTIRKTLRHIRAQNIRDRLEVVIVAPSANGLGLDEAEPREFFQVRVVEVGAIRSIAWANAAGIRQARAPIVILAEDHCPGSVRVTNRSKSCRP